MYLIVGSQNQHSPTSCIVVRLFKKQMEEKTLKLGLVENYLFPGDYGYQFSFGNHFMISASSRYFATIINCFVHPGDCLGHLGRDVRSSSQCRQNINQVFTTTREREGRKEYYRQQLVSRDVLVAAQAAMSRLARLTDHLGHGSDGKWWRLTMCLLGLILGHRILQVGSWGLECPTRLPISGTWNSLNT